MIQRILAIWSLVPLAFLNPTCTSGSSQFMYCWSLIYWYKNYHFTWGRGREKGIALHKSNLFLFILNPSTLFAPLFTPSSVATLPPGDVLGSVSTAPLTGSTTDASQQPPYLWSGSLLKWILHAAARDVFLDANLSIVVFSLKLLNVFQCYLGEKLYH